MRADFPSDTKAASDTELKKSADWICSYLKQGQTPEQVTQSLVSAGSTQALTEGMVKHAHEDVCPS